MGVSFLLLAVFLALLGVAILQSRLTSPPQSADATTAPPTRSAEPSADPSPDLPSDEPSAGVTDEPSSTPPPSEEPSPVSGSADDCVGTDDNRAFLANVAEDLDFEVYCVAVSEGWTLTRGSYTGRGEGRVVVISYRGPDGATLVLRQGNACAGEDPCPRGEPADEASFGGVAGELLTDDDDVIVSAEGDDAAYIAEFEGVDEETARELAEGLLRIEG
jgi:hypothetical protein